MKKIIILLIVATAYCFNAKAQIISSHFNDNHGTPFFRIDVMKSAYSSSDERGSFIPEDSGYHGLGFNASIGYYFPLFRSYFFYAPEVGLTGRMGNDRNGSDDMYYASYLGVGLKLVPLQFGYQFEVSQSISVCPRIGMAASIFPFGSLSYQGDENAIRYKWEDRFETIDIVNLLGCDLVFKNSNFIISLSLESGHFTQAGVGIGFLF